jgi:3-mercaptopyruvate sulfurtransferase SseA
MRKVGSLAALSVFCAALLVLAACKADDGADSRTQTAIPPPSATTKGTTPAQQPKHAESNAQRISIAEARAAFERGEAIFVDVRSEMAYKGGHIKGAVVIPENDILARAEELPRDKMIITYCA